MRRVIDVLFIALLLIIVGGGVFYFKYFKTHPFLFATSTADVDMDAYWASLRRFEQRDTLLLKNFAPQAVLVTPAHKIRQARFPIFDVHTHLNESGLTAEALIALMDSVNVRKLVNLGTVEYFGAVLEEQIATYQAKYPDRIVTFANLDFRGLDEPGFAQKTAVELERVKKLGVGGIKIWRNLGLLERDAQGRVVPLDDPRLDAIWAKAGELQLPVLMHTADPTAFWRPVDRHNERYMELQARLTRSAFKWGKFGPYFDTLTGKYYKLSIMRHPERLFYHTAYSWDNQYFPSKEELMAQRIHLIRRHPETIFIGAHMGYLADDLAYLGAQLDALPNFFVEMSHVVNDLGRLPYTSRDFFIKYQDRIMFGLDGAPEIEPYRASFRFLETADEYFDFPRADWKRFGNWKIYGISLPDSVLEKIYAKNAERILGYQF